MYKAPPRSRNAENSGDQTGKLLEALG